MTARATATGTSPRPSSARIARATQERPNALDLTGKQRRHLRALGHHLDPVVQLGKAGLTDGVVAAVDAALERHELVKVRLGTECPDELDDVADSLSEKLRAALAQTLGRTILLYRRHPKEPKIKLPAGG